MRLLKVESNDEISLTKDLIDDVPPYAILSHTWGATEDEVSFHDLNTASGRDKVGYQKIEFCRRQVRKDDLQYFWVDTCCIDTANHVELSEAITSMFRWYRNAVKCYVYLSDVSADGCNNDESGSQQSWLPMFRKSRWFTRGWTLQELLAPRTVEFFSRDEELLGDKKMLQQQIQEITGIPVNALNCDSLSQFSINDRMRWAANRETTKKEDKAYCLLGIFDISMSLRYGEGEKAFSRLERKVNGSSKCTPDVSSIDGILRADNTADDELINWLSPARPEELQIKVSASRHPHTGLWFTGGQLSSWVGDEPSQRSLTWLTGNSGSGKTTLFSCVVEKMQVYASASPMTFLAYHYCTFGDPESQKLVNILGSLVVQISAWQLDVLEDLKGTFERDKKRSQGKTLQVWQLEQVLVKHLATFKTAFILLDALDESEDFFASVTCISNLLQQLPNLKVLVTSTRSATAAGISQLPYLVQVDMHPEQDIRTVVNSRLRDHPVLQKLSSPNRKFIESMLTSQADQTFRWVCLVLDDLCRQRTGRAAMRSLTQVPNGLNETYAQMLDRIPLTDRTIAREVLLWLSFALRPMTLVELSEAAVLEDSDTTLDQDTRLHDPHIILDICHGLLEYDAVSTKVKLAHASVKNYLLSDHARTEGNSVFRFDADSGHRLLTKKCLTYLMFSTFRSGVAPSWDSVAAGQQAFPLLDYAAHYWGLHASSATKAEWSLVEDLFATKNLPRGGNYGAWVSRLVPHHDPGVATYTEPLYYAASFGWLPVVRYLLSRPLPIDLEHPGGRFGSTALQVACFRGRREIAEVLVEAGADFWSIDGGSDKPAWFWAQSNGWTDLVQHMIKLRPEITSKTELDSKQIKRAKRLQERFYRDYTPEGV